MNKKFKTFIILLSVPCLLIAQLRNGDSVNVINSFKCIHLLKDSLLYRYKIVVSSNSNQSLVSFSLELGTKDTADIKTITINNPASVNWGGSFSIPTIKPENFGGSEISWVPLDTLETLLDQVKKPRSSIDKGDSILFSIISSGLPSIKRFWVEGWYKPYYTEELDSLIALGIPETTIYKPWYSSGKSFYTVSPRYLNNPVDNFLFLDTLINYNQKASDLLWVKTSLASDKYNSYLFNTKSALQQNNISLAKANLQKILHDVDIDSSNAITSEAYALLRYNTEYLLSKLPQPPIGLPVKLANSTGIKLTDGVLQYYEGAWKDAINNNDGTFTVPTTLKTVSLRMTYAFGSQTKSNVTVGADTVVFQTVNTQVKLQNSSGAAIDTGKVQYYAGAWREFGSTANGVVAKELLPGNYSFRTTYAYASIDKAQDVGVNPIVIFQTVPATVQLKNSSGNFIDQGTVQYYSGAWRDLGVTTNGVTLKELLPNNYSFRMNYAFASKDKAQDIGVNSIVVFQTVPATVQLKNSLNNFIDQGTVQYYSGAWRDFGTTTNGAIVKELLPNNYSFRMNYAFASKDKAQDIGVNPIVVFQTVNTTVQLKNSLGNFIDQGTVQYYSGAWRNFGSTINGIASLELLPNNYSFRMTYEFVSNDKAKDVGLNNTVTFSTVLCRINVKNAQNQPVDNARISYYSGAWRVIGNTINGTITKELLPFNLQFRLNYGTTQLDKTQNILTNNVVEFGL